MAKPSKKLLNLMTKNGLYLSAQPDPDYTSTLMFTLCDTLSDEPLATLTEVPYNTPMPQIEKDLIKQLKKDRQ